MPKTRNAFALKGFDSERILQRPFFKRLKLPATTDEKILQEFKATDNDSSDVLERKLFLLELIEGKLVFFHDFISRHQRRLTKSIRRQEENKDKVVLGYFYATLSCAELQKKISVIYEKLEGETQQRYREEFAERLRAARKAAGLTQLELGDLIKVSPQGISNYERAVRDVPIHVLIRLARQLGLSGSEILGLK